MENKGIIKKIKGKDIYIELFKDSSCAHCSGCGNKEKTLGELYHYQITDGREVEVGDMITFEVNNKFILNLALVIYMFPVFLMIASYILANRLGATEGQGILVSFSALIISFLCFFLYDRKKGAKKIKEEVFIKNITPKNEIKINSCGPKEAI